MVATLVRLRLTLLRHTLGREPWRVVLLVLGLLWAVLMLPSVLGGMVWVSGQDVGIAHDVLVLGGALVVLGWVVVPLLVPALDDSLEIGRFTSLGVPADRLVPGLLAASLLGVPTLFTALLTLAPALGWSSHGPAAVVAAVLSAPVALVTCVLAARLVTAAASRLLASRRSREISTVLGLLVAGAALPLVLTLGSLGLEGALEKVPTTARVLGWTPFGAVWAVPADVAAGGMIRGTVRWCVAVAWVLAGVAAWTALLRRALVRPPVRGGRARRRTDSLLPGARTTALLARRPEHRAALTAAFAVARRAWRYWIADPRYLSAMLGGVVAPLLVVLLLTTVVDAPLGVALALGPIMAGTLGWGRHNDVAFDGAAFWMHVVAAVPGWADRLGRLLAVLAWTLPVTLAVAVGGAVVAGRTDLLPAVVGVTVGVLGAGLAVSAVSSASLVYPVPEPGGNPFAAPPGSIGASLVAQTVSSAGTFVLAAPVLALYVATLAGNPGLAWVTGAVGVLGAAAVLTVGVVLGGRVHRARAVRLLARLT